MSVVASTVLRMADLARIRSSAESLIAEHLGPSWSFAFDHARTRAGLCSYAKKQISVSRLLAPGWSDLEAEQTILHELAHALAGHAAGHGPEWRRIARSLGYTGGRTHDGPVATERANWVGECPAGHRIHRFRRPTRAFSCAKCSRRYDPAHRIEWRRAG
jgi:predicted SprT family Zn-dependent metalloprotease